MAFSADHGVTRIPEDLIADGIAGRFSSLSAVAENALLWMLGAGKKVGLADGAQLSLTKQAMAALQANPAVEEQFVTLLKSAPGTAKVFRAADLAIRPRRAIPIFARGA